MKTNDKPSDLIHQAITNLGRPCELAGKLWELQKEATLLELKEELKNNTIMHDWGVRRRSNKMIRMQCLNSFLTDHGQNYSIDNE